MAAITLVATLVLLMPSAAMAIDVTEPDTVQTSYTERYRGTKVTANFGACGATFERVDEYGNVVTIWDYLAKYSVTIQKGGTSSATIWAHSIWRLDLNLYTYYGYNLTQAQIDSLVEGATNYTCVIV